MAVFIKDQQAWDWFTNDLRGPFGREMSRRGVKIWSLARQQVGVDTGKLRTSITYSMRRVGPGIVVRVGSSNPIALLHHEGTRPHTIDPNKRKVLRFRSGGMIRYTHVVNHPGTRPNRYLTEPLNRVARRG